MGVFLKEFLKIKIKQNVYIVNIYIVYIIIIERIVFEIYIVLGNIEK
jgi:hypothetical protein